MTGPATTDASESAPRATTTASGQVRGLARAARWLPVALPAAAELAVGGYQIGGPSLWRDEGYTREIVVRPAASIVAILGRQDAVHGLYYLIMHVVVRVLGTSEVALRLPSLLAACAAAGLTAAVGRRLWEGTGFPAPSAVGTLAGLALVALPLNTWYAQDARPYAMATLCAVAATWLLISAAESGRWQWRAWYAVMLTLLGWLNVFALLLIPAHGISLLLARRVTRGWLIAAGAAVVACAPLMVLGARQQSGALYWVTRPDSGTLHTLIRHFGGTVTLVPVAAAAAFLCLACELRPSRMRLPHVNPGAGAVALPWLVLPPGVLLAVSLVHPVYVERYVVFCLPAIALLVAAGVGWLGRLIARRQALAGALAMGVIVVAAAALLAGPQRSIRLTSARPDNLRQVAAIVAAAERPGDAVVYLPWDTRVIGLTYPAPFDRLDDIGQQQSPVVSDTIAGTPVPASVLLARLPAAPRLWVVRWAPGSTGAQAPEQAQVLGGLRPLRSWKVGSVLLGLYLPVVSGSAG